MPTIKTLPPLQLAQPNLRSQTPNPQPLAEGAKQTFSQMFAEVNRLQHQADQKIAEFSTDPNKDVHGTMIAIQKAEISLRLLMQVRSKITSAYQEVSRMQI